MAIKKFQRNVEDFTCDNCGKEVSGTGYTNHCPACLWSKHVDVNPGDRAENCGGLMELVDVESKAGEQVLVQKCQKCGHMRKNKVQDNDDVEVLLNITKKIAEDKYLQ